VGVTKLGVNGRYIGIKKGNNHKAKKELAAAKCKVALGERDPLARRKFQKKGKLTRKRGRVSRLVRTHQTTRSLTDQQESLI